MVDHDGGPSPVEALTGQLKAFALAAPALGAEFFNSMPRLQTNGIETTLIKNTTRAVRRKTDHLVAAAAVYNDPEALEAAIGQPPTNEDVLLITEAKIIGLGTTVDAARAAIVGNNFHASEAMIGMSIERLAAGLIKSSFGDRLKRDTELRDNHRLAAIALGNDSNSEVGSWTVRLVTFINSLNGFKKLDDLSQRLEATEMSEAEIEELSSTNDALFAETVRLQEYDLTSVVARSNLSQYGIREWLVESRTERLEAMRPADGPTPTNIHEVVDIAQFLPTGQRFTSSKSAYIDLFEGDKATKLSVFSYDGIIEEIDPHQPVLGMPIRLGEDGELYALLGMPLTDQLEPKVYELLRADVLALYADLVVPVAVAKRFAQREQHDPGSGHTDRSLKDTMTTILISRRHYIQDFQEHPENYREENDYPEDNDDSPESAEEGVEKAPRPIDGYLRPLPPGHRASSAAHERYAVAPKRPGWPDELPEGYNYVRPYQQMRPVSERGTRARRSVEHSAARVILDQLRDDS